MKITAFVSGAGTTLAHLLNEQKSHPWQVTAVISDQANAEALNIARQYAIEPIVVSPKSFAESKKYEAELLQVLAKSAPDMILLLGYLKQVSVCVVGTYRGKIFNTHPSLLPKYGGKGMYGRHVHEAVIKAHDLESGVTIHEVSEHYDDGKILLQKKLKVEAGWSAEHLETAIKRLEKSALVEFLNQKSND